MPRDMAKFGQLFLDHGYWQGAAIIPESWVATSSSTQVSVDTNQDYGYQWWLHNYRVGTNSIHSYAALGYAGQRIEVFPELEMVVVMTAYNPSASSEQSWQQVEQYILPAALP